MSSRDAFIDFEADNWDTLAEKFIMKYGSEWDSFVYDAFMDNQADYSDYLYEQMKEKKMEQ